MKTNRLHHESRMWFVSLTVVFAIQTLRELLSHMIYNFQLAPSSSGLAFGTMILLFMTGFLVTPLERWIGSRRLLWISGVGISATRLALQITNQPMLDLAFSAMGMICFFLLIPLLIAVFHGEKRLQLVFGVLLGIVLETGIHGAFGTLGLVWRRDVGSLFLTAALVVSQIAALRVAAPEMDSRPVVLWRAAFPAFGWGFVFLLNSMFFQNIGLAASSTGLMLEIAFLVVAAGNFLGVIVAITVYRYLRSRAWIGIALAGAAFVVIIGLWPRGDFPIPALWAGMLYLNGTLALILDIHQQPEAGRSLRPLAITTTISALGLGLFTALYYIAYVTPVPFNNHWLLLTAAAVVVLCASIGAAKKESHPQDWRAFASPVIVSVAILISAAVWVGIIVSSAPEISTSQPTDEVRVMTYNLHNGFDTAGRFSMEELAKIIEESEADIVGLQEVSRGWMINGSFDMLTWLQRRLDMPYAAFAPTSDAQWGMALLSRYPIVEYEMEILPTESSVLQRGLLWARIDLGEREFPVIVTHFHHLLGEEASMLRVKQAGALLDYIEEHPTLVVMGDMNAIPGSLEMQMIEDAGWINAQDEIGRGNGLTFIYSSYVPPSRLDWIFARPEVVFSDLVLTESQASDHLSVAVDIKLP